MSIPTMAVSPIVTASDCLPYGWEGDMVSPELDYLRTYFDSRILSGAAGSVVSGIVVTPFEVAKVKQQNQYYSLTTRQRGRRLLQGVPRSSSSGVFSTIRHVVATEGVRGAYAGLAPTLIMAVPNYVLFLLISDDLVTYLRRNKQETVVTNHTPSLTPTVSENAIPLVAGALARLIASTAIAPFEMLRTRDASLTNESTSRTKNHSALSRLANDVHTIVKKDGVGALYKGLVPTLWRDVPFAACYMVCLERFRDASRSFFLLEDRHQEEEGHNHRNPSSHSYIPQVKQAGFEFTNAALAGMVAASCTAPLDVVKTRLQSEFRRQGMQSTLEVLQYIVKKEGIVGLWRGNQARMMKVASQYAIMISFFEMGKKIWA